MEPSTLGLLVILSVTAVGRTMPADKKLHSSHIYEGKTAEANQFPWMVNIKITAPGKLPAWCGGSLISVSNKKSSDIVLTAAHCVAEFKCDNGESDCSWRLKDLKTIHVIAGDHYLYRPDPKEERRAVATVEYHPSWNRDERACLKSELPESVCFEYDLALVKVSGSFKFSKGIKAIKLPEQNEPIVHPGECTVAGWGVFKEVDDSDQTAVRNLAPSSVLRTINVTVPDLEECAEAFKQTADDFTNLLCAKTKSRNGTSCEGDSGGPLWCQDAQDTPTVVGVVSGSDGACGPSLISAYGNVAKHIDWIQGFIQRVSTVKNGRNRQRI